MIFDIGDKVWHKDEKLEVTVIEISDNPDRHHRTYSVAQSEAQIRKYGRVNWVAWLHEKDVCSPDMEEVFPDENDSDLIIKAGQDAINNITRLCFTIGELRGLLISVRTVLDNCAKWHDQADMFEEISDIMRDFD